MLPVTLQIPAAILLVLGGAVACFAGYRFFRIVLGLYGFVLGALLATTVAGAGSTSSLVMWAVVGGVAGALVSEPGVLLRRRAGRRGAGRHGRDPALVARQRRSARADRRGLRRRRRVGGDVAAAVRRGDGHRLWRRVDAAGRRARADGRRGGAGRAAANDVWVVYPLDPAPGRRWLPVVWLALGAVGVFVQLRKAGPRIKKAKRSKRRGHDK